MADYKRDTRTVLVSFQRDEADTLHRLAADMSPFRTDNGRHRPGTASLLVRDIVRKWLKRQEAKK